jgi:hypothetical protein
MVKIWLRDFRSTVDYRVHVNDYITGAARLRFVQSRR